MEVARNIPAMLDPCLIWMKALSLRSMMLKFPAARIFMMCSAAGSEIG
jgi:hypothetical protein